MTTISSKQLNDEGCSLLSRGSFSEGLEVFQKALVALKREIHEGNHLCESRKDTKQSLNNLEQAHCNGPHCFSGDFVAATLPAAGTFHHHSDPFWIYARPLFMPEWVASSDNVQTFLVSASFTVCFNIALTSHLQGMEQWFEGDSDAADHSLWVAKKMYNLTLGQLRNEDEEFLTYIRNDFLVAVIVNNLIHVHATLREDAPAMFYSEQLLTILFYFAITGVLAKVGAMSAHDSFMENATLLTMKSIAVAAAA